MKLKDIYLKMRGICMAIIIGDIHGQYNAFRRIIYKIPSGTQIICVGDLIDRGPEGPEVIQYCMENNITCLKGNHEDMMVDYYEKTGRYQKGIWIYNGGNVTLANYETKSPEYLQKHIDFIKTWNYSLIIDDCFVSHAPMLATHSVWHSDTNYNLMWNRELPSKWIKGQKKQLLQVFGHNSHWGFKWFKNAHTNTYALCIDTTASKQITTFDTISKNIVQENY